MDPQMQRNLMIAMAVIVVAIIMIAVLAWSWDKCHLGKYSKKTCPKAHSHFCGAPPAPAARAEAKGLMETGWRPDFQGLHPPATHYLAPPEIAQKQREADNMDDSFAARKVHRDKSTFINLMERNGPSSNPAQISARQARHNSVRGVFSGADETDGWEDTQATVDCIDNCMDGCGGTNCYDHCTDRCQSTV